VTAGALDPRVARLRRIVRLWDQAVRVPGTRFTIGLDPLLGLIPGLGDALGALVAGSVLLVALQAGVPPAVAARMLLNVALDASIGAIPVAGDLFDFGFRANARNLALLERWVADPARAARGSRVALGAMAVGALTLVAAIAAVAVWIGRALLRLATRL
jgi:hypothetical protein